MSRKERKPFGKTKVGQLLKNVGSPALELLSTVVPSAGLISNVIDMVTGDKSIDPKAKAEILAELDHELEYAKVEAADRANARQREIEVLSAGGSNWFQYVVGIFVLTAYGAVIYEVLFGDVDDKELFYFIAGNVFAFGASVVAYYFGTSKSSADKDKKLH
jgi:hypothetical protein